jgi:hypothetical protein
MIHVPDVRATVAWYEGIGFDVLATYGGDGDGLSFAILGFGSAQVMFSQGGEASTARRREVDLYVYTEKVDEIYERLKDGVDIVEKPHDSFYGMRELIIRDLNRFWITFGQTSTFASMMNAIQQNDIEQLRLVLKDHSLKPATLTAGLAAASDVQPENAEIVELLKTAGAVPSVEVDEQCLRSYAGTYKHERGFEVKVVYQDGKLFGALGAQEPLRLLALDCYTFRPVAFDDYGVLRFIVENNTTVGCVMIHNSEETKLKRA